MPNTQEKGMVVNPFALYNPAEIANRSPAGIKHTGLRKRNHTALCVGTRALDLANRPQALLFALLDRVATESASSPMVIYPAVTTTTLNMKLTAAVAPGKPGDLVTLQVENSTGLQPADLLTVAPYGEQFWVKHVPSNTTLDVLRVGNFPSLPIQSGRILMHTGNAVPEGSMRRLGHYYYEAAYRSSRVIVRNGWSETGSVAAIKSKEGNANLVLSEDREGMIMDHALDINKVLLYGQSFATFENGLPFTMGDGIISAVRLCAPQNVINIAAPVDLKVFGKIVQRLQQTPAGGGVEDRLQLYCDWASYDGWQELGKAENGIMINSGTNNIGLVFSTFVIGGKTIEIIYDEGMDENAVSEGIQDGFMFFFNPQSVVIDYFPGRRGITSSYKGINGNETDFNSADITAESILSEFHVLHKAPHANGIITGFNANMVKPMKPLLLAKESDNYFDVECV